MPKWHLFPRIMNCRQLSVFIVSFWVICSCVPRDRYISFSGYAQGGTYTVKLNLNGRNGMIKEKPQTIRDSVEAILQNIDNSLSGYNKNSTLSRFNAGERVFADSLFLDIYRRSYAFYEETDGIVDVASAPLFDIWGFGFKSGNMPTDERVQEVLAESGMNRLVPDIADVLDVSGRLESRDLLVSDGLAPQLNYNAVAQGYSCDVVARYLRSLGVKDMMVDIGEIFCDGRNPSGHSWTIGIDRPVDGNNEPGAQMHAVFKVPDGAYGVVTSGNYRKFYVKDGKKYAHTIDPRTGYPVTHNLLSATIMASDAISADAYATYCMVVGLETSKAFIEEREDLEGCLVYDDGGEFRTWCSSGFVLE